MRQSYGNQNIDIYSNQLYKQTKASHSFYFVRGYKIEVFAWHLRAIFIASFLLLHKATVLAVSSEGPLPPDIVAFNDKPWVLRNFSNPDHNGAIRLIKKNITYTCRELQ